MQNKPNLLNAQMNLSSVITMNYEQLTMNYANKNKPNTKPIQTQYKANQTQFPKGRNERKLSNNKEL